MSPVKEKRKAEDDGNRGKEVQENATEDINDAGNANKWGYSWGQNLKQVEVTIPLPVETRLEGINCVIKEKYLLVGIVGMAPILAGKLFQSVRVEDSFWAIEKKKSVHILLKKVDESIFWNSLIKRDIDIEKAGQSSI